MDKYDVEFSSIYGDKSCNVLRSYLGLDFFYPDSNVGQVVREYFLLEECFLALIMEH